MFRMGRNRPSPIDANTGLPLISNLTTLRARTCIKYIKTRTKHYIHPTLYLSRGKEKTTVCNTMDNRGRKEMFYLTTHSTHFIYGYMASDMVKDHSDSEKGNPLPPHGLLFSINSKGSFICTTPQTG